MPPLSKYVLMSCVLLLCAANLRGGSVEPLFDRAPLIEPQFQGPLKVYLDAITEKWLLTMPKRNPALLLMFANRDKQPLQKILPWSGEFAGKYLTGAVQVLRLTRDTRLNEHLKTFVAELIKLQDEDGYLGPFPQGFHLTGKAPNLADGTWDAWGHYHIMLGLLLWHEESGDANALACAQRIGDLLCKTYLNAKSIVSTGSVEMNHAVIHGLCLLYRKKPDDRYLHLAKQVVSEFETAGAGDYIRVALAGKEFFQGPKPRWESLHPIMGISELHLLTGDASNRQAFEQIWWSIAKLDRHNNGGFSSGEQAQGNPYHRGAIETCCTVAWMAASVEMLRLTGKSIVADELELSLLNSVYGYQSRDGVWCTYNTPMDGKRIPSMKDISFQIRPGSEEINCCSANAPRGFGLLSDWALMRSGSALVLNWYGPSKFSTRIEAQAVTLTQQTDYPKDGRILMTVYMEQPASFPLLLRIPHWSQNTRVQVNGVAVENVRPAEYLKLDRKWQNGDSVEISLDLSLHYWAGEREYGDKTSVYRGPILLGRNAGASATPIDFSPQWKKYGDLWASDSVGSTASHTFKGTSITWHGFKFDDAGKTRVLIDGKETAVVDQYESQRNVPFAWTHDGLADGTHVIKLEVLDEKNEKSKGRFANVASFGPIEGEVDAKSVEARLVEKPAADAWLEVQLKDAEGRSTVLRDFASCGIGGISYSSWLKIRNAPRVPFAPITPWRSGR